MSFVAGLTSLLEGMGPGGPSPIPPAVRVATLCDLWAQDCLEVTFQVVLANDALLKDAARYTVTPVDGGRPVAVREVQTGKDSTTPHVWLILSQPESGKTYEVTFDALNAVDGVTAQVGPCKFIGRPTKEDSIINSRPAMYDMRPNSVLRILLQAIGRQDDLIGGARSDDFVAPLSNTTHTVVVAPLTDILLVDNFATFTATVDDGSGPQNVHWFVNDIPLGNAEFGTITVTGPNACKYTAPSLVPTGVVVTLKAVSDAWNVLGDALITIVTA